MTVTTNGKTHGATIYKSFIIKDVVLARHVALVALVTIYHVPLTTYDLPLPTPLPQPTTSIHDHYHLRLLIAYYQVPLTTTTGKANA